MRIYPIADRNLNRLESFTSRYGFVGICSVCGLPSYFGKFRDNHRELGYCILCKASNRKRQLGFVLRKLLNFGDFGKITSDKQILNAEASGGLHHCLKHNVNYVSCEYFGRKYKSGDIVNGILNVDLAHSHFEGNAFDVVMTSDVFEHIPDPYKAFKEIYRILKPGGVHIFTVPFYQTGYFDEKRAEIMDGEVIHHMEPIYHLDPLNPDGILVYNIFSLEMLLKLAQLGFRTTMHKLYDIRYGIFGNNGLVFESKKI
ncbi:MAG: class I SAM-dependent methyltransferase [Nitrosospira multiformis]|nr:class I SAM-dependent methyltransferase [Nitrosospira multiformis]